MISSRPPARALSGARASTGRSVRALAAWPARRWAVAAAGAALTAAAVGVPTDVVPNPLFSRSVPVQWWNHPVLAVTAALAGLLLATYTAKGGAGTGDVRRASGKRLGSVGGVLSLFAVGCPVCNKLVLLLAGTSGALTVWAPLQPLIGLLSIGLLAVAAVRRLSGEVACPAPPRG